MQQRRLNDALLTLVIRTDIQGDFSLEDMQLRLYLIMISRPSVKALALEKTQSHFARLIAKCVTT